MPSIEANPSLPWWLQTLARPLGGLPGYPTQRAILMLLNQLFSSAIVQGELDFLAARTFRLQIEDIRFNLLMLFDGRRLLTGRTDLPADVSICGSSISFLRLMSRREDPDSLFFQRRLRIEGEVELGLAIKNFLDAWERPRGVAGLESLCAKSLDLFDRKFIHQDSNGPSVL